MQHYLHMATRKPLLQTALQMLLAAHTDAILEKGFTQLMDQNRVDDLGADPGFLKRAADRDAAERRGRQR